MQGGLAAIRVDETRGVHLLPPGPQEAFLAHLDRHWPSEKGAWSLVRVECTYRFRDQFRAWRRRAGPRPSQVLLFQNLSSELRLINTGK